MKMKNKIKILNRVVFICVLSFNLLALAQLKPTDARRQRQKLAYEYERLGEYEQALRIFNELYQQNPNDFVAIDGIQRILFAQKRYPEVIQFLENSLKHRYEARIHSELGSAYYLNGDKKQAEQIWAEVIKRNEKQPHVYQFVARAMLKNRLYDEAIEIYLKSRKRLKDESLFTIELANLYAARNDYRQSTREYLAHLKHNPKQLSYIKVSLSHFVAEDRETADLITTIIKENITEAPQYVHLRRLLIDIYLTIGKYQEAFNEMVVLDEMTGSNKKDKEIGFDLFDFGNTVLQNGAYAYAERAFELVLTKYPHSIYTEQARFGLARSHHLQENYEQALLEYENLIKRNNDSYQAQEALFQIGDVKLNQQFDPAGAREAYRKIITFYRRGERYDQAIFKIGECYFAEGNLKEARKWFKAPLKEQKIIPSTRIAALYNLALVDLVENQLDAAQKNFDEIIQEASGKRNDEEYVLVNDALEWSLLLEENRAHEPSFRLFLQTILLERQRKFAEGLALLDSILTTHSNDPIADEAFLKKGKFLIHQQDYVGAIKNYQTLIDKYTDSFHCDLAKFRIGEVYESGLGDYHQAIREYEEFLVAYPNSMFIDEVRRKIRKLEQNL